MMTIQDNYSLLKHNTFGIDAFCHRFVEVDSVESLQRFLTDHQLTDGPLLVIGGGSNLLFTRDYEGTVLHVNIRGNEVIHCPDGETVLLRCGAGEVWDDVVGYCVDNGWYGMENLSLIPGEVGASAVQNIGAYGVEVCELIESVEAVEISSGNAVVFTQADCHYGYRQSIFKSAYKGQYVITHVTYRLTKTFKPKTSYGNIAGWLSEHQITDPTAADMRRAVVSIRQEKLPDPRIEGNAGSFFMNPIIDRAEYEALQRHYPQIPCYPASEGKVKVPAGWLIDQCGWKGRRMGRAGVHDRQALVLVNKGGATGYEVLELCRRVMEDVEKRFGITLHPEVNIL